MEILIFFALLWVGMAVAVGEIANRVKGRDATSWFLVALLVSPLIALIMVAVLPAEATAEESPFRKCPACAETIKAEARICRYCRTPLSRPEPQAYQRSYQPPVARGNEADDAPVQGWEPADNASAYWVMGIVIALFVGLFIYGVFNKNNAPPPQADSSTDAPVATVASSRPARRAIATDRSPSSQGRAVDEFRTPDSPAVATNDGTAAVSAASIPETPDPTPSAEDSPKPEPPPDASLFLLKRPHVSPSSIPKIEGAVYRYVGGSLLDFNGELSGNSDIVTVADMDPKTFRSKLITELLRHDWVSEPPDCWLSQPFPNGYKERLCIDSGLPFMTSLRVRPIPVAQ